MIPIRRRLSCQDFVEQITPYLEITLPAVDRERFEEHYVVCPPCRWYYAQMRTTAHMLSRLGQRQRNDQLSDRGENRTAAETDPDPEFVRSFKFLDTGRVGPLSRVRWPPPEEHSPGDWVESDRQERCVVGVHACLAEDLPYWLAPELWIVELEGVMERAPRKLVARRGRLVSRVSAWTPAAATDFADSCISSLQKLVVNRLCDFGVTATSADDCSAESVAEQIRPLVQQGRFSPSERTTL
jgi:hypothetical protein